jgi:hypothetical protein
VALYNEKGERICDLRPAAKKELYLRAEAVMQRELIRDPRVKTLQCRLKKRWFSRLPSDAIMKIAKDTGMFPKLGVPRVDSTIYSYLSLKALQTLSFHEAFEALIEQWQADPFGSLLLKAIYEEHRANLAGTSIEARDALLLCYLIEYEEKQSQFIFYDALTFLVEKAQECHLFDNKEIKSRFSQDHIGRLIRSRSVSNPKPIFSVNLLQKLCRDTRYFPHNFQELSDDQQEAIRNALIIGFKNQGRLLDCSSKIYAAFERYAPHDREFWKAFIECNPLFYLPPSFKRDQELLTIQLKASLLQSGPFSYSRFITQPGHYQGYIDREQALLIVKKHGPSIHFLSPEFRTDEDIRREACKHWVVSCQIFSGENRIRHLIEQDPLFLETFLQYAPSIAINTCLAPLGEIKEARLAKLFIEKGGSLAKVAPHLRTPELSLLSVEQNRKIRDLIGTRILEAGAGPYCKEEVERWIVRAKTDPRLNAYLEHHDAEKDIESLFLLFEPIIHNSQDLTLYLEYITIFNKMKLCTGQEFKQADLRKYLPRVIRKSVPYCYYLLKSGLPLVILPSHCIEIEAFILEVFSRKNLGDIAYLENIMYFKRFEQDKHREFAEKILQRFPWLIFHFSDSLGQEPTNEQIDRALQSSPLAYHFLPDHLKKEREWAFLALTKENWKELSIFDKPFFAERIYSHHQDDLEVIEAILDVYPEYFKAFHTLQENKRIAAYSVERDGNLLQYVGTLKKDKEIVLKAVKNYGPACIYAARDLKNDLEIMDAALQNPLQWDSDTRVPIEWFRDAACLSLLIEKAPHIIPDEAIRDTEDYLVQLAAVRRNGYFLRAIPIEKQTQEFVTEAVLQNPRALQYANIRFRHDPKIKKLIGDPLSPHNGRDDAITIILYIVGVASLLFHPPK